MIVAAYKHVREMHFCQIVDLFIKDKKVGSTSHILCLEAGIQRQRPWCCNHWRALEELVLITWGISCNG